MNTPDTPKLRAPLRFVWLWLAGAVIVGLMAKPVFHLAKTWRAENFARAAEESLSRGEFERAQSQAKLSLELHSGLIRAIRVFARIADQHRDPVSLKIWLQVVQSAEATDADRLALAEAAMREDVPGVAEPQLAILLSRPTPAKEAYHLEGWLAARQQRLSEAREWFQKALSLDPSYARTETSLGQLELYSGISPEVTQLGRARLQKLATRNDAAGLESLRLLVQWSKDHARQFPYDASLAERLRHHPQVQMRDQCLAADWEIGTDANRQTALEEQLIEQAQQGTPDIKREVALWLNRHRRFQKTITVFPLDDKAPDDMVLVQLDALAGLGEWEKLSEFLANNVLTSQPMLQSLYRARAALELKNEKLFELGWNRAVREAGKNLLALRYLAEYAERIKQPARAAEVYETLSQQPGLQVAALVKLVRLYERLGQTRDIFRTMQRLLVIRPTDSAVLNDVIYLGLLLNESAVGSVERARQVYAINPKLPAHGATCALAELKAGSAAEALRIMEAFDRAQITAPSWQAVHAASLFANGRKEEAMRMAQHIDWDHLKSEEKALVADFRPPR